MLHTIIVDWGTTNFRAMLVDAAGVVVSTVSDPDSGMKALAGATADAVTRQASFSAVLERHLAGWIADLGADDVSVVMSGMVGSKQGYVEVAYVTCPLRLSELRLGLAAVPSVAGAACAILPGVSTTFETGLHDVMRGEETQLLGIVAKYKLWEKEVLVCLPGTHSKWAQIDSGTLRSFRSFMTGELFQLLAEHSILSLSVDGVDAPALGVPETAEVSAAFIEGCTTGYGAPAEVAHLIFMVRTKALFRPDTPAAELKAFLSGVLIGTELAGAGVGPDTIAEIWHVGSAALCSKYSSALQAVGVPGPVRTATAEEATIAGALAALAPPGS